MPISFSQTANLECLECYVPFRVEAWLIKDAGERADLAARCREDAILDVTCLHWGNIGTLGAPLLCHDHARERLIQMVRPNVNNQKARKIDKQLMPRLQLISPNPGYHNQTCSELIRLCKTLD